MLADREIDAQRISMIEGELPRGIRLERPPRNGWRRERKTTSAPFRYICYIATWSKEGGFNEGTGVLIAPDLVLAAGHTVMPVEGWKPETAMVFPGRNGGETPFGSAKVQKIALFPGFKPLSLTSEGKIDWTAARFETDLSLLFLDRRIGEEHGDDEDMDGAGWWGRAPTENDRRGSSIGALSGWARGRYRVNVSGYPSSKAIQQWRAFDDTLAIGNDERLLFLRHRLASGHSGSPVWVKRSASKGGRVLAAIFVGWKFLAKDRAQTCARRIDDDVAKFIKTAKADLKTGRTIRLPVLEQSSRRGPESRISRNSELSTGTISPTEKLDRSPENQVSETLETGDVIKRENILRDEAPQEDANEIAENSIGMRLESEVVEGSDSRSLIRDTTATPFRWICSLRLEIDNPNYLREGRRRRWRLLRKGTGVLIGPSLVLTAAHTLWFDDDNIRKSFAKRGRIVVVPGGNNGKEPFGTATANAPNWTTPKQWSSPCVSEWDFAVIKLEREIGKEKLKEGRLGWWGAKSSGYGSLIKPLKPSFFQKKQRIIRCAGYPFAACGNRFVDNWRRCSVETPNRWASTQWYARGTSEFGSPASGFLLHNIDTTQGQSGSPIWYYYRDSESGLDRRWLIGIHTGAAGIKIPGKNKREQRTNTAVWIRQSVLNTIDKMKRQL